MTNVVILHGSHAGREQVALELHAASPGLPGPYFKFDCVHEQDLLGAALRDWIAECDGSEEPSFLTERLGTLFLDEIEFLSDDCQRLLLIFVKRLAEMTAARERRPIGRVIAGSTIDLEKEVEAERFLPQLFDALNKGRVVLRVSRSSQRGRS
jgi:DNA-binding NtrC family response regulator